ncbi:MAG: Guanylate kinase [Syntrophomonadaceae bacterium]|nr:Guanylate kinase [Bacillota bacterium]
MKFDKPTLITLTAPTCSGKTHLLDALTGLGCGRIVSTTTRSPRKGETEGVDYFFISDEKSRELEATNQFFELIEFRGARYGVTHHEMASKMANKCAPIVILEPKGLAIYEQKCYENGWGIYRVYVSTVEKERIRRLNTRMITELQDVISRPMSTVCSQHASTVASDVALNMQDTLSKIISTHTDRLLSIAGEERYWLITRIWDAIVPGDDLNKALDMLSQGVEWRNRRNAQGMV